MTESWSRLALAIAFFVVAGLVYKGVRGSRGDTSYSVFDLLRGRPAPAVVNSSPFTPLSDPIIPPEDIPLLSRINDEYTAVIGAVVPSVVSINTSRTVNVQRRYYSLLGLSNRDQDYRTPGLGSGVIVSREGHILTNHHVIADVDEILVTLNSGKRYQAKLVGSDARSDIAVLKIAGGASEIFPALPLGDSDEVRVGEMVFAVGNPFGLNETVTRGIISARERRLTDADNSFFQTDAVINRGSSGGPLVNLRGEVIGINVYIYSGEHGVPFWQGVGLSIPSNDVREAFDALMKGGRPSRGYLGIGVDDINPEIALVHGLNNSRGVIIEEVVADSPAADAGLQPKDVILKFDGRPVLNTSDLIPRVRARSVGSGVVLGIRRNRRDMELSVVIGERSTEVRLEAPAAADSSLSLSEILAVEVRSLNAREREARGLHPETPAIIISRVPPDSPAANSLQVGDLVHEINRQPISNPGEFTAAIDSMPLNHTSVLFVTRNGSRAFVVLEPRTGPAEGG